MINWLIFVSVNKPRTWKMSTIAISGLVSKVSDEQTNEKLAGAQVWYDNDNLYS